MMQTSGAYSDAADQIFLRLANEASDALPIRTRLVVPTRRVALAWARLPHYVDGALGRGLLFALWFVLLGLLIIGIASVVAGGLVSRYVLLAPLVGRSVLPLASAVGSEPRYMVEALPAVFVLAGIGLGRVCRFAAAVASNEIVANDTGGRLHRDALSTPNKAHESGR
jgi:hypothetical protein